MKHLSGAEMHVTEMRTSKICPLDNQTNNLIGSMKKKNMRTPGKPYWRGSISTVDFLIKIYCFVKEEKYSVSLKKS
jgi:hypothetical protein